MDKELFDSICEESRKAIQESKERWAKFKGKFKTNRYEIFVYDEYGALIKVCKNIEEVCMIYDVTPQRVIACIRYKSFYKGVTFSRCQ